MSKLAIFYVIRPQPSLLKMIDASGVDGADLLSETELWEGDCLYDDGGVAIRHPDPHELSRVKLLFLGRLVSDYASDNATEEANSSLLKDFVSAYCD
jgi:hypothetical protein